MQVLSLIVVIHQDHPWPFGAPARGAYPQCVDPWRGHAGAPATGDETAATVAPCLFGGRAGQRDALLDRRGPVVDPWEQVRVHIHPCSHGGSFLKVGPDGVTPGDHRVNAVLSVPFSAASTVPLVLWLLRHGDAEDGSPDAERRLTDKGERQSRAAGAALAAIGAKPDACLTSPKVRAAETARLACEPLGVEPRHEPRLAGGPFDAEQLAAGLDEVLLVGHDPDFSMRTT